jgi:hypothetical protein
MHDPCRYWQPCFQCTEPLLLCHDVAIKHLEGAAVRKVYLHLNFVIFVSFFICGLRQQHQLSTFNYFSLLRSDFHPS